MPNIRNRFEDPDVFDSRGILKDGAVARVRMSMRDAADDGPLDPGELAHRLQMLDAERRRQGPVVADAAGDSLFGLRKPGFRYLTGGSHRDQRDRERLHDARRQAHIDYVRDLEGSWRTPASTIGAHANSSPVEGDLCTTSGGSPALGKRTRTASWSASPIRAPMATALARPYSSCSSTTPA